MGKQGKDEITAHDLGRWTNTFAYEIMTRMGKRLPVVYKRRSNKPSPLMGEGRERVIKN